MRRILGEDWATGLAFAGPLLVLLVGLIGWPMLQAIWMSFYQVVGPRWVAFVGLDNYRTTLEDPIFRRSLGITVQYTAESIGIKFVVGLTAALALHNVKRFGGLLTALILAPYIVPEVVTAAIFRFLYNPTFGGLNATLKLLYGITHGVIGSARGLPWTGDPAMALHAMVAVNVWKGVPFFTLLALAGMKSIDRELYDAAAVDGANAWQRFLHITLPGLRYVIVVETLFSLISTFNTFGLIYLITVGGPGGATRVYAIRVYEMIGSLLFGRAVALAMVIAPILAVAVIILGRYMRAGQRGIDDQENLLYRGIMFLVWPIKMALRLVVAGFWIADRRLEWGASRIAGTFFGLVARRNPRRCRAINRTGSMVLLVVPLVLITGMELYPFYWIFITAFKTNLQIQKIVDVFWPTPWTLEHFPGVVLPALAAEHGDRGGQRDRH